MDDAPFDLLIQQRNELQRTLDDGIDVWRPDLIQDEIDFLNNEIARRRIARREAA